MVFHPLTRALVLLSPRARRQVRKTRQARRARKVAATITTSVVLGIGSIPAGPAALVASIQALTAQDSFAAALAPTGGRLAPVDEAAVAAMQPPASTAPSTGNHSAVKPGEAPGSKQQVGRNGLTNPQPAPDSQQPSTPGTHSAPVTFKVASWNVLGASHTEGKGCNRCHLPDSVPRMVKTVQVIRSHDLHVIGLQEFQPSQQAMFHRQMPNWAIYANADNAIAWDTSQFTQVATSTLTIPYFGGNPRAMPQVRLRHNASGREFEILSVHTPADVRGPAQHLRNEGVLNLGIRTNAIIATNTPVLLTGDMNDRENFYCQMTGYGMLHASAGGTRTPDTCTPPSRMDVDWILGDTQHVTFAGHVSDDSPSVDFASDHPIVVTTATLN